MPRRLIGSRTRDVLAYVCIGIVFVATTMLAGAYSAHLGEHAAAVVLNWLCLGGVMAVVFSIAIHEHRRHWGGLAFWSGSTLALLAETAIGVLALRGAPRITVWLWALLYPLNAGLLEAFLTWWLQVHRAAREERGGPTTRCS